jgi:hypothetical protein
MKRFSLIAAVGCLLLLSSFQVFAQDEKKSNFDLGSDFVNRYVWRGTDFGNSPSIQPYLSYSIAGFEIGAWGSFSTNGANMQEVDLYASYTFLKDMFSIGVTDYFFPNADTAWNHYFNYKDGTTGHVFEASVSFNGTEKVPVYFNAFYNFYGADADNSVYLELGYSNSIRNIVDYSVFCGASIGEGIYVIDGADGINVVNLGLTLSKDIRITEKWSLPVFASLVTNPQAQNIFFVFGFSL